MRFIITGANSFIGEELVDSLLLNGHEVIAVCRRKTTFPERVSTVYVDMCEYGDLHKYIEWADVFINLAWRGSGHDGRYLADIQKENIHDSINAIEAACKMKCKLFVEAGSQAEYGSVTMCTSEMAECHPFSEYGKAKLELKERAFSLCERNSIKYIHLRIFSIFGENDHPWTMVMSCIDKMLRNETIEMSACTQYWNFLYVKDAVRQIVSLCDYALNMPEFGREIYNIASEDTRPLKEFVEEMKILCKSNSILRYGAIQQVHPVSLLPDVSKTKKIVGTISLYSFEDVINIIVNNLKNRKL